MSLNLQNNTINIIVQFYIRIFSLQTYTVTLDTGEAALAVAVGEGWSAVATSQEELRLFSSTGIPIALISLRGPVVTMVGYIHQLAGMRTYACTHACVHAHVIFCVFGCAYSYMVY